MHMLRYTNCKDYAIDNFITNSVQQDARGMRCDISMHDDWFVCLTYVLILW